MSVTNSVLTLLAAPVILGACARFNREVRLSPDAAAVQSCASSIALNEGYEVSGRSGAIGAPSDGMNWSERLELRVRLTGDSAVPDARIRTATSSGRSSACQHRLKLHTFTG